jgi:hypothetical protein
MTHNFNIKIGKLKDIALERCRDRIEKAACKAKGLMKRPESERAKEDPTNLSQPSGITSFLKKRHGL